MNKRGGKKPDGYFDTAVSLMNLRVALLDFSPKLRQVCDLLRQERTSDAVMLLDEITSELKRRIVPGQADALVDVINAAVAWARSAHPTQAEVTRLVLAVGRLPEHWAERTP